MTRFRRIANLAVMAPAALAILAAGCTSSKSNGFESTVPISTKLRMYQPNDSYTWSITGTETPQGAAAENITGTRTFDVTSVTANGSGQTVNLTSTESLTINGTTTNTTTTIVWNQASDGSVTETSYTENGTTVNITSNSGYATPGTFGSGVSENGNLVLSNGETEAVTASVGAENSGSNTVSALDFNWDNWPETANVSLVDNAQTTTETANYDWAPALGEFLQETLNETEPDGTTISETYTLTGTSVASSNWTGPKARP